MIDITVGRQNTIETINSTNKLEMMRSKNKCGKNGHINV